MRTLNFLLIAVLVVGCRNQPPIDLETLDAPPPFTRSPAEAPNAWLLAHVDVETTGLLPGYHEMIDIGLVMTDLTGYALDTLFLRIQPQHPERLSPGAKQVNAFDPDVWKQHGALDPVMAVDRIIAFHRRVAAGRPVMLIAHNAQFDTAFLDHLFRNAGRSWRELYHYYVLDIPSMLWARGYRNPDASEFMARRGIVDEPHVAKEHTGLTGALVNVRVYRELMR